VSAPDRAAREELQRLLDGDEEAFRALVREHHGLLLRLAMVHVPTRADAEEVVQETWLAVLEGIDGFAGRAALRTWICRILLNIARRRAGREARTVPLSALTDGAAGGADGGGPTVDPDRFFRDGPHAGHWRVPPRPWSPAPADSVLADELRRRLGAAVDRLAPAQREVIVLRDVHGWSADEVCELLRISQGNQRVLLHRARARVRRSLADYLADPGADPGAGAGADPGAGV
jgi:RNA polymerase sigma-70 factor, ECF subfamily